VRRGEDDETAARLLEEHAARLGSCEDVEAFLWPRPGADWLAGVEAGEADYFEPFREQLRAWQRLALLPIGELVTGLAQDLFVEPEKLAMAQLFGEELSRRAEFHLGVQRRLNTLDDFQHELEIIARDQRRLRAIEADKTGFDPNAYRGQVAVATMHGAKGLEWDRVYLLSVNDYHFPSGAEADTFQAEKWFVRDRLNLEAETMAQLDAAIDGAAYVPGEASRAARLDYARERLRLLYVGLTRARRELIVTANHGKGKNRPAAAFAALERYVKSA
jgi:DNA helicase-2/ATP-dependent DNA helicase PcrA